MPGTAVAADSSQSTDLGCDERQPDREADLRTGKQTGTQTQGQAGLPVHRLAVAYECSYHTWYVCSELWVYKFETDHLNQGPGGHLVYG